MWQLILDSTVVSLLLVTIFFCWKLNERITELRNSKKDLLDLIKTFDDAIKKTNQNVTELRSMSRTSTTELQNYIQKANELISDLSFLTDSAGTLADRLEKNIRSMRTHEAPSAPIENDNGLRTIPSNTNTVPITTSPVQPTGFKAMKASFARTRDEFIAAIKSSGRR
jgi:septation ring formation regulator EzrA